MAANDAALGAAHSGASDAHVADTRAPTVWTLTTGEAGMTTQVRGLAEALGWPYRHVEVRLPRLSATLPWWVGGQDRHARLRHAEPGRDGDWSFPNGELPRRAVDAPHLVISCGRRSALVSQAMRSPDCFVVHLQNPQIPVRRFDRVVAPEHDCLTGPNVLTHFGALHRYSPKCLEAIRSGEGALWTLRWSALPRPWLMVLVGGPTRRWKLDRASVERWSRALDDWAERSGGSVLVTPSRRTPDASRSALQAGLRRWLWDGQGENPYPSMLALGDAFAVSADSVSMLSEAAATRRALVVLGGNQAPQRLGRRLALFHASLVERGYVVALEHLDLALASQREVSIAGSARRGSSAFVHDEGEDGRDETARIAARIREDFLDAWRLPRNAST